MTHKEFFLVANESNSIYFIILSNIMLLDIQKYVQALIKDMKYMKTKNQ